MSQANSQRSFGLEKSVLALIEDKFELLMKLRGVEQFFLV